MKSSCIQHPARERLVLIRQWQLEYCDGNQVAAALLSFFEYWHNIKLDMQIKAADLNRVAELHNEIGEQDTTLWQHHSAEELVAGIMGIGQKDGVRKAMNFLQERNVVEVGKNPDPRFRFDRTNFYRFHPEVLQAWLETDYPSTKNRTSNSDAVADGVVEAVAHHRKIDDGLTENRRPSAKNRQAISETSSLDSNPEKKDDRDDAADAAILSCCADNLKFSLTEKDREKLKSLRQELGPEAVVRAILVAGERGASKVGYIVSTAQNEAKGQGRRESRVEQPKYGFRVPELVPTLPETEPEKEVAPPAPVVQLPPALLPAALLQAKQAWETLKSEMKVSMPTVMYDSFLRDCIVKAIDGDVMTISIPDHRSQDWLKNRMGGAITWNLQPLMGRKVALQFVVEEEATRAT